MRSAEPIDMPPSRCWLDLRVGAACHWIHARHLWICEPRTPPRAPVLRAFAARAGLVHCRRRRGPATCVVVGGGGRALHPAVGGPAWHRLRSLGIVRCAEGGES